jgi:hypothetical protein
LNHRDVQAALAEDEDLVRTKMGGLEWGDGLKEFRGRKGNAPACRGDAFGVILWVLEISQGIIGSTTPSADSEPSEGNP